jgi:indolepyruvate ferredoxin oxidoreductase beta subunit
MKNNKNFNLIIAGVGGQGLITLLQIIDEVALLQDYDIKSSELHGLSQRGGSVLVHIRFGEKVYSPMVMKGEADLIIGLELSEGTRAYEFSGKNTKFLINNNYIAFDKNLSKDEYTKKLEELVGKNLHIISASEICKEKLEKDVLAGIYLLGYAVYKNLIPLKKESVIKAIEQIIPENFREINIKAFTLIYDN